MLDAAVGQAGGDLLRGGGQGVGGGGAQLGGAVGLLRDVGELEVGGEGARQHDGGGVVDAGEQLLQAGAVVVLAGAGAHLLDQVQGGLALVAHQRLARAARPGGAPRRAARRRPPARRRPASTARGPGARPRPRGGRGGRSWRSRALLTSGWDGGGRSLEATRRGCRSSSGGDHEAGSAPTCSPERMSFTSWPAAPPSRSPPPARAGNHTKGMPRRSAWRICLPNRAALGATSTGIPRARRAVATASESARSSSSATATSTAAGTGRVMASAPAPISAESSRVSPREIPTPGVGGAPVGGQRVVAAPRADRAQRLEAGQGGLVDGAGVVVQAAGDRAVGHHGHRAAGGGRHVARCPPAPRPARPGPSPAGGAPRPSARTPGARPRAAPPPTAASARAALGALRVVAGGGSASIARTCSGPTLSSLSTARSTAATPASSAPSPRWKPSTRRRLFTRTRAGGRGSAAIACAMTTAISTSWWGARTPRSTTSMSAWTNSRYRPSWGRSPRQTLCTWWRRKGKCRWAAFSAT